MNDHRDNPIEDIYELSAMQQGMLFQRLYDADGQTDTYFEQVLLTLDGDLQVPRWQQAWQAVAERHAVLRSAFHWQDLEQPLQVVHHQVELPWEVLDWRDAAPALQETRLTTLLATDRARGLALDEAPLMRFTLIHLGERHWQLLWTHHHILIDGWSMAIILREAAAIYAALVQGEAPGLAPAPRFTDYIRWTQVQDQAAARGYWQGVLQGFHAPTPLPLARPAAAPGAPGEVLLQWSAEDTTSLGALARRHRLTPNTLVQGAWALLLARYSGAEEVVFGVTVAGRPAELPGVAQMVGLLINTLPLRVRVAGERPALAWLHDLQMQAQELGPHQFLPLAEIQAGSEVPKGTALFDSILVFESYPMGQDTPPGGLAIGGLRTFERTNYPLTLIAVPEATLTLRIQYDRARFADEDIRLVLGHLDALLRGIGRTPEVLVRDLPWLSDTDVQTLAAWNATATEYPADGTVVDLFERQVAAAPDAVAVVCAGEALTYGALNARANRVAHALIARGVGPDTLVALCMERSSEMVVGLLGILKAGGAYVPLDPDYPAERLRFMLADSAAALLLTQAHLRERLPGGGAEVLSLEGPAFAQQPTENPGPRSRAEHLAYVIYTSGSTGRPKGVCITQRAVVSLVKESNYQFMDAACRMAQASNVSFDAATYEMWGALLNGGCLVHIPKETLLDPARLIAHLEAHAVTSLFLTTALFNQIAHARPDAFAALDYLLFGGERVDPRPVAQVRSAPGPRHLLHVYGPTETTTYATWHPVRDLDDGAATIPIGRPLSRTRIHILDHHLQPVPIGVPGELCIAGEGLARGYLNRPDLTAERFVAVDLCGQTERVYRTGDLARWRPDGNLEFLGRLDHQVKIRGFRIEPGEVEAALLAHPAVREAVVLARPAPSGDLQLVAYVVPAPGATPPTPTDWRTFLHQTLPEHMLPGAFVALNALPLTPNGKLDRQALPAPDDVGTDAGAVGPRDALEEILLGQWASVLNRPVADIHANFFELGGHSLLATQLASRLHTALEQPIPLRWLFDAPTVATLAARLRATTDAEDERLAADLTACPLVRAVRPDALPLSFAQQRLWFLDQLEGASATYNIPAALALRGTLDVAALEQAFAAILCRHEVLRTCLVERAGTPVQVIGPPGPLPLPVIDLRAASDPAAEVARRAQVEAATPFDLAHDWPIRAQLLWEDHAAWTLLLTLHHSAADGWSFALLNRELASLYRAFRQGVAAPLAQLPLQYVDYGLWQRAWLTGARLERELALWRTRLAGAPECLHLPTDRPRPAQQSYRGADLPLTIPAEVTAGLRALSQGAGATLFMTLLAAWGSLLARYSGAEDLIVGSPVAGRTHQGLEPLIGFFVNTLALRLDLTGQPSFHDLLARVRSVCLEAYAHQEVPFERLVEALEVPRNLAHAPLFQVMFVLQNTPKAVLELPDLEVSLVETENQVAKFDLMLSLTEVGETLQGTLEYATDLFDRDTIERLGEHFLQFLRAALAAPEQPVGGLELLPPQERRQLLVDWNDTAIRLALEGGVHTLFEAQAARTPTATAVIFENAALTYGELNAQANRLAHALIEQGIGPDATVAIALERSPALIVALLAILKAGGAYVPLDPTYPVVRFAYMLEDCGARLLLTQTSLRAQLPATATQVLCLDTAALADHAATNPSRPVAPNHLAYVIYTSGSTGQPKGVAMPHLPLVNLLLWQLTQAPEAGNNTLQYTTLSFDVSFQEIFGTLATGGSLYLIADERRRSSQELLDFLVEQPIERLFLPYVALNDLCEWIHHIRVLPRTLKVVFTAGEQLRITPAIAFAFQATGARLHNQYGPTETHVVSSFVLGSEVDRWPTLPPIGRPIANTRLYVLDRQGQPVPLGVPGELHIGGAGVARGYLNRPELTAERFVASAFVPGDRLYRTGDRVRYRPDGNLEFLGRLDHQVKIRGFRIETGEVEAALAAHPAVREAVVLARPAPTGDLQLVAYVVSAAGMSLPTPSEWRTFLQQTLPDYMLPGAYVALDRLPLTPNGKLDRQALPAPDYAGIEGGAVGPRDALEEILLGLWASVLNRPVADIHANFFALGGHSLLATQVASRLHTALKRPIPVRWLFDTPSVAALAARLRAATDDADARLAADLAACPLVRAARPDPLPLSFAQQRLWFLDQLEGASATYNMPAALALRGTLDLPALQQALTAIVARHEALRTTLVECAGVPVQVIAAPAPLPLPLIDLRTDPDSDAEVARRALAEADTPFDLARDWPIRAQLLWEDDCAWTLLLTQHHSAADGWSFGLLSRELVALYTAFSQGAPSPLADLPLQYADYALWQRAWLRGERLERELTLWRTRLAGAPECLHLPTDRPRPAQQSHRGASLPLSIPADLTAGLRSLSQGAGVTLFMTLLAAWGSLLGRYSGEDDIVIGSPVAGRTHQGLEPLIGFFVNTLALRLDLTGQPSFGELLARVRSVCLEAYTHQEVPFERLVEALEVPRSLAHAPLFQVMFVLQNTPEGTLALPDLAVTPVAIDSPVAKFDLTLALTEVGDTLQGELEYATDLFDRATIERLSGHFVQLLRAALAAPQRPVGELDILSQEERQQLLIDWNATATALPPDGGVHTLFEAAAARAPSATAVVFAETALTYGELNAQANRLAHRLIELGVGPESTVAIVLGRSPALIVALLATLKAGGAYVPLDPAYPAERLAYMLEDCGAQVLLTETGLRTQLPAMLAPVLCLDTAVLAHYPATNPGRPVDPQQLAYVIYTSGSTGQPKGVLIEQGAITRHCHLIRKHFALTAVDRVLQFASPSFDASLEQILPTLGAGAALVLSAPGVPTPEAIDATLRRQRVSVADLPPAFFEHWLQSPGFSLAEGWLRLLVVGGDLLPPRLVSRWHAAVPDAPGAVRLLNGYGPTETTITATFFEIPVAFVGASVPIGRPLPHRRVYVLDPQGQPVPRGVAGELYIGGTGVARGYLNRPDLTALRFIESPFVPGDRLYRTGDRVRYRPDGNLEFLGRLDHQVKIRGFRIEPGEVEAALAAHPAVREAVVLARPAPTGDLQLVAYVVPQAARGLPTLTEWHAFLGRTLPDYMLPGAYVALEALPLTPNGKLDRQALSAPDYAGTDAGAVGPRDALEEILLGLWASVLHRPVADIHANFFALGGHSLLATQVASRLHTALKRPIPVRWLFDAPSVAALAARLRAATDEADAHLAADLTACPLVRAARPDPLPLSFAQQRLWFLDQLEGASATYNIPAALALRGTLDLPALQQALTAIVARHEALRTTLVECDGIPVQVIAPPAPLPLPLIDLRADPDPAAAVVLRAQIEAATPFDLAHDWPIRAQLLWEDTTAWTLLLTLHHSAADGWSFGLLSRELVVLYTALRQGEPSPLTDLPLQYADYALWQRAWLCGDRLERELTLWRTRLAGAPECLHLPTDRPRPAQQSYRGASLPLSIPADLTAGLRSLSQGAGVTLFMTLLAAWGSLLGRYSGEEDLVIGSPVAGRTHQGLEPLIGFFVNTLALRLDLTGQPSFHDLLGRVRSVCLEAYAHQEVPFERLVEVQEVPRNLAQAPLFQVMFVLQNTPQDVLELPDLAVSLVATESDVAKFDLTLALTEVGDTLQGGLEYATDLFDRATIKRLSGHFVQLLRAALAAPERPVGTLDILSREERQQLLSDWNATATALPPDGGVHTLFEASAARAPSATAVVFAETALTYGELNAQANRLAHALIAQGVGPESMVAIALERSPALIVALLATLKAGGAYVPLDPAYPVARLAYMLADCGAQVLLTQTSRRAQLPATTARVLCLDSEDPALAHYPATNPGCPVDPRQLAYVIYTSGSTGQPKAVAVMHNGFANLVQAQMAEFSVNERSRCLQFVSPSFDVAGGDIFTALSAGATLVLCPLSLPGPELVCVLKEAGITHWRVPVAALSALPAEATIALPALRCLVVGGAPCPPTLAARWAPGRRFFNAYGPTETTVCASIAECVAPIDPAAMLPIGRPLANTRIYVLDPQGQPVPVGVTGELYIGGAGVARGYLNRPELTAERFVASAFVPGDRLYRTGDRVRYRPDGNLEFLGRLDHQVKIRGFRIETGEVEAALATHPAVREAVVLARPAPTGDLQLVAYVVPAADMSLPTPSDWRAFLQQTLPEYMLPGAYVGLDAFPLTANGKLDRQTLATAAALPCPRAPLIAPRSVLELQLLRVWQGLLKRDAIDVHDSFFDVGGNSLLAASLATRIERVIGERIPLVVLFQEQTIARQAAWLHSDRSCASWSTLVPLQPHGEQTPLFCVHPGAGTVIWYRHLAYRFGNTRPFYALESQGLGLGERPLDRVEDMASLYIAAMRSVQPQGPYLIAGWCFGGVVAFEMALQLLGQGQQVALLAVFEAMALHPPFDETVLQDVPFFILLFQRDVPHLASFQKGIAQLGEAEQLQLLIEEARKAGEVADDFDVAAARRQLAIFRGHLVAQRDYALTYYPGKATFIQAANGLAKDAADPLFGWGAHVGEAEVLWVPGDHTGIMTEPHVGTLAQTLERLLAHALPG